MDPSTEISLVGGHDVAENGSEIPTHPRWRIGLTVDRL